MSNAKWVLDPSHSELTFRVKHMMITHVKGEFRNFSIDIHGEDFQTAGIKASVDTASVFTNSNDRDAHLRSADFFESDVHPNMLFEGTSFQNIGDGSHVLKGILTIKGISKEISLDVEFGGINKDPWGNEKAGFSFTGKINRKEWGLNWNAALEAGGVLVSEEVKIEGEVQFAKQSV